MTWHGDEQKKKSVEICETITSLKGKQFPSKKNKNLICRNRKGLRTLQSTRTQVLREFSDFVYL